MMRLPLLILTLSLFITAQAQHSVTIKVSSLPPYHKGDKVFVAGNFNNWNPQQERYALQNKAITLIVPKGVLEFKLTRGGWDKVELGKDGILIENRRVQVDSDTVINVAIEHWADHFPFMSKQSSANSNVRVLDTAFYMPQLGRHRRVWVYLPESYGASRKKYPVLYMHDGQNVFDAATSFSGEWGVDEALDTLGPQVGETIVVAIDNGGDKRLNEYAPYDMEKYGKGEGDQYVDFIVKTLKPYIEKNFRVKKCRKHRFIAGSSMGGLISFYAMLKYPKTFGGAGVFSPAFWIVPQLKEGLAEKARKVKGKIYFFAGKQESESMVPDMLAVFEQMNQHSKATMTSVIRTEGKHAEATWRQEFPLFYKWLME